MKKRFARGEIVERLRDTVASGQPIVGAGCSAGLIARAAEVGGTDLIICYSTGQSRIRGLQTVNIDHANPQTLSMFDEISNVVRDTPIVAGVEACDQTVYDLEELCGRFVDRGYDGIINFPTQGGSEIVNPQIRRQNQQTGRNLDMPWASRARSRWCGRSGGRTCSPCATSTRAEHAAAMVKAGVDVGVCPRRWNRGRAGRLCSRSGRRGSGESPEDHGGSLGGGLGGDLPGARGPFASRRTPRRCTSRPTPRGSSARRASSASGGKAVMGALQGFKSHTIRKRRKRR